VLARLRPVSVLTIDTRSEFLKSFQDTVGPALADARRDIAQALIDQQSLGVVLLDSNQRILFWNRWMAVWTGLFEAQVLGESMGKLFPGLKAGDLLTTLVTVSNGGAGICWQRELEPERLDLLQSAMTGGKQKQQLCSFALRPVAGSKLDGCAVMELMAFPERPADTRPRPGAANVAAVNPAAGQALIESDRLGVLTVDNVGFIRQINPCMEQLLGYSAGQLLDKPLRVIFPDISGDEAAHSFRQVIEFRQRQHPEGLLDAVTAEGQVLQIELSIFGQSAQPDILTLLCRDATRGEQAAAALLHQREQLTAIYSQVADGILLVDRRGSIDHINPVGLEMLGLTGGSHRQANIRDILLLQNGDNMAVTPFDDMLNRQCTVNTGDNVRLLIPGREPLAINLTAVPLRDRVNRLAGGVIVMRAASEFRRVSTRLSWQATHDPLTQLPNRRQIENEITRAIDAAHLENCSHMLLYLDLYNFSVVNDTCGHTAGDELLRRFSSLLAGSVEKNDVIARIGNDEFAILLWDRTPEIAREDAERLLWRIKEYSFPWGEQRLRVGVSIGTRVIDRETSSEIDVLVSAGASCAAAKESGRNRIHFHHQGKEIHHRRSMARWTTRISEALEQGRFAVYCQPIVPLRGVESIRHFEALVRMVAPDGNIISPGRFIPAAENSGLVDEIDRWVLDQILVSLEGLAPSRRAGIRFSVNLSGTTIGDERFRDYLLDRLRHSSVDAGQIQFEITETSAIRHFDRAMAFIKAFRGMGCHFSLDDFGSGLSSFGYLKALPVDYLKIDGGFIRNMELSHVDHSMVSTINHLAHVMGIDTIAESVETRGQLSMLETMGIDYAQGYYLGAPLSMDRVLK